MTGIKAIGKSDKLNPQTAVAISETNDSGHPSKLRDNWLPVHIVEMLSMCDCNPVSIGIMLPQGTTAARVFKIQTDFVAPSSLIGSWFVEAVDLF